jgi:hypothetical protein
MANESLVGTEAAGLNGSGLNGPAKIDLAGFRALRSELKLAEKSLGSGLLMGVTELATGGGKVKAVWESIKWGALARAGLGGIALLTGAFFGLTGAIRKGIRESGILQAAFDKLGATKILTTQFTQFLGNVEAARRRVGELYQFVSNSKFNISETANASKVLTILSNGALGGRKSLEQMGNISKVTDNDLESLSVTVANLNAQIRRGENISGTLHSLQEMGVISESAANQITALSKSGANSTAVWAAVSTELDRVSDAARGVAPTMDDLEDRSTKARTAMAQKFGEPFLAAERESLLHTIELTEALTPAVQRLGQMLAGVTAPAESVKSKFAEIYKTDWFRNTATRLTEMAVILPGVAAALGIVKGLGRFSGSVGRTFMGGKESVGIGEGFLNLFNARPSINPRKALERSSTRMLEIAERLAPTSPMAARGAELASKGLDKLATGAGFASSMVGRLIGSMSRFLGIIGAVVGVTYLLSKAWDAWEARKERIADVNAMKKGMDDLNESIRDQIALLKSADDKTKLLIEARQALAAAIAKRGEVEANPQANEDQRAIAEAAVLNARRRLRDVEKVDEGNLAPGQRQLELVQARLRLEKEIRDIVFEGEFARADSAKQVLMLLERIRDKSKIVEEGKLHLANLPRIEELQKRVANERELRESTAKGLADRRAMLSKRIEENTPGMFQPEVVKSSKRYRQMEADKSEMAAITERLKTLRQGSPEEIKAQEELASLRTGAGASRADRYDAAAEAAKKRGNFALAAKMQEEAERARVEDPMEAARQVAMDKQRVLEMRKEGRLQGIGIAAARQALSITSETVGGADATDRIRMAALEKTFQENRSGVVGEDRDRLDEAHRVEIAEIQKDIDERARGRARETAAWQSAISAHEKNNEALIAAAKGNFAQADAAAKAAQQIEDNQAKVDRAIELRSQGFGQGDIDRIVGTEQRQREADRATRATAFRTAEGRRVHELELANVAHGIGGGDAGAARRELKGMQDIDAFREQLSKNMEALGPGHTAEAAQLALRATSADILAQTRITAGSGQVADSLAALGLGGGVYAGVGGDPQLEAQKRIGDLTEATNKILLDVKDRLNFGVK